MRKFLLTLIVSLTIVSVTGCSISNKHGNSSIKNVTEESLSKDIIKGVTTQEDVRKLLGNPIQTTPLPYYVGGNKLENGSQWLYRYGENNVSQGFLPLVVSSQNIDMNYKTIHIDFDKDKKVRNFMVSTTSDTMTND